LKENVVMGRLIPAGTGLRKYSHIQLAGIEEPAAEENAAPVAETESAS